MIRYFFFIRLLSLHAFLSLYLSSRGSIFSLFFLLEILLDSATLKNLGANSASHFGSIARTERIYSLVVKTNS